MPQKLDWTKVSAVFQATARVIYEEAILLRIPVGELEPPELAVPIDRWCRTFACTMDPGHPWEAYRPWIFARLISASSVTAQLAKDGVRFPHLTLQQTAEQFLIAEWHGVLRLRWPQAEPPDPHSFAS